MENNQEKKFLPMQNKQEKHNAKQSIVEDKDLQINVSIDDIKDLKQGTMIVKEELQQSHTSDTTLLHAKKNVVDSFKMDKESEEKKSNNNCEATIIIKKIDLEEDVVYHMSEIGIENLSLYGIHSNRRNKKQIDNKLKSCEIVGVQVPIIITNADIAIEAGYKLDNFLTGNQISTPEEAVNRNVTVEGHNRVWAYLEAVEKAKRNPHYSTFDLPFIYKKYPNAESFRKAYRNMNLYNVPTKTKEFANDILATTKQPVLIEYKNKIMDGLTAKAAGYATIGREIVKRDMENIFNGKIPSEICDPEILTITEPIYHAVMQAFSSEKKAKPIVKGTPIWTYNAKKFSTSENKKHESDKLVRLYSSMGSRECSKLMDAKAKDGRTKEQIVHDILEKRYITL